MFGPPRRWLAHLGRDMLPMVVLTLAGVAAVSVIGVVLVLQLRSAGIEHEKREAEEQTELVGRAIVAPLVTGAVLHAEPAALAQLDRTIRRHVVRGPVVRVKLWSAEGRIVYSDATPLIGRRFALEPDDVRIIRSGGVTSELSDLSRPENRFERGQDRLLEVYSGIRGPDGTPVLFESYHRFQSITASGKELGLTVLPALLGGMLLLELANLGLARWFGGHIRRRDQQRAALLARALDASNTERRRITADLHDGVVQDMSAAAVSVTGATRMLDTRLVDPETISALEIATDTIRKSVGELRTLLIDFYPADLESRGLASAIGDLVALARTRGLAAELDVSPLFRAPAPTEGLLFRVAQEGLRNAAAHARARSVSVTAGVDDACYWLEVRDDGEGFDTDGPAPQGHIGLRALRDLLAEANGRLAVHSRQDEGTVVRAELRHGLDIPR